MKIWIYLITLIMSVSCTVDSGAQKTNESEQEVDSIDFDSDTTGYKRPEDIARGVIEFLQFGDTSKYLELAIPLEVQKYFYTENFEDRPDITDRAKCLDSLEEHYDERMNNFLVRSGYIHEIMLEDKDFKISEATIDTITYEISVEKTHFAIHPPLYGKWMMARVQMSYNGKSFYFEIPQIVSVKRKWFLYYPEFYIRDERDMEFLYGDDK